MSRLVRRVFAPSFIITVAGSASLVAAEPGPSKNPPAPVKPTPPAVKPVPKEPVKEAPKADRHWRIYTQDTTCFASDAADACPPPAKGAPMRSCNPPPPTKYACPDNATLPINVVQRAGSLECFVDYGAMTCPKGASCNPPPPRKLACP